MGLAGWSISDASHTDGVNEPRSSPLWNATAGEPYQISVRGYAVPPSPTTLTLTTDATNGSVGEDVGLVTVTATLDEAATSVVSVTLTAAGTAVSGPDYTLPSSFTITVGETVGSGSVSITDDDVDEVDETIVLSASGTGLNVTGVTVTITDDDTAGVSLGSTSAVSVVEGSTVMYAVVLESQPTGDVTVTATSGSMDKATVSAAVTFTTSNWSAAQSFTVSGVDAGTSEITHAATSTDPNYQIGVIGAVAVTVDNAPGVTLGSSTVSVVEGATVSYSVVLDTKPTGDVTVTATSGSMDKATVSAAVTFTTSNWSAAQSFTVTGDAAGSATVTHAATSADSDYGNGLDVDDVVVTVKKPPPSTLTLSISGEGNTVGEADGSVVVTATLNQPARVDTTVTLTAKSSSTASATDYGLPPAFTIKAGNTMASGTVTITNDDIDETNETLVLTTTVSGLATTDVTITITDDDTAGVTVSTETVTVDEQATEKYTVVLTSQPAGEVVVTATSGTPDNARVSAAVTFTSTDWDTVQSFTVTGVKKGTSTVTHAVSGYGTVTTADSVTVTVNTPPPAALTLEASETTTAETDTETVTLTATLDQPAREATTVTFAFAAASAADADDLTVPDPFTAVIAKDAKTVDVEVTVVDDDKAEGTETAAFTASAGSLSAAAVSFTITDDDEAGVTVSTETVTVDEQATEKYTVVLTSQPAGAGGRDRHVWHAR